MKLYSYNNCASSLTITNNPDLNVRIRRYKDHTIVYKMVAGKLIRLKQISSTHPVYAAKLEKKLAKSAATSPSATPSTNSNQPLQAA